jgi:exopolyphosphatase/guanosine-5'-triphosphate,3'-diphosphate pyrophosphatase
MTLVRAACVDIGSNTTRLLIADCVDGRLAEIHQERVFTRIGRALTPNGRMLPETIATVTDVVASQVRTAADYGVGDLRGVATAAVRDAVNGEELVTAIAEVCGLQVVILSAEDEARLAFIGAAASFEEPPGEPLAVIDVGGGSSELVVGVAPGEIQWWVSLPMGSGAVSERHLHGDPPAAGELAAARAEVRRAFRALDPPAVTRAIAVGGSATSLARVAGVELDGPALARACSALVAEPAAEVAARFAIDPERARLLAGGLLILESASECLGLALAVGRGGIREGVLLEARQP